jgi:hypothetical protein
MIFSSSVVFPVPAPPINLAICTENSFQRIFLSGKNQSPGGFPGTK